VTAQTWEVNRLAQKNLRASALDRFTTHDRTVVLAAV
jgi:hypothetical protein